ncbi:MAG: sodium:proton antiporter [Bacteroidales bacterium]
MENITLSHIAILTGITVVIVGLWAMLTKKNIIKIIIGFSLFDTGIHIIMVGIGYIRGKKAPILDEAVNLQNAAKEIVDPVPQALVLTAIVIGLGITALMLAYALKLYQKKKTLEINKYDDLKW